MDIQPDAVARAALTGAADSRPEPRWTPRGSAMSAGAMWAAVLLLAAVAGSGWYWWQRRASAPTTAAAPTVAPAAAEPASTPVATVAAAPAIAHPIEPPQDGPAAAPLAVDPSDTVVVKGLIELVGARAVGTLLRSDDFVRRVVVTLDNLGRAHAAPRLWPTHPMAGRFATAPGADAQVTIAPANAARYAGFVAFVESIDMKRAAALYRRHYPLFQAAYRELGYPNAYFNDRVVAVINQMLATPEPAAPPALRLVEVKGELASTQPWTRWEFADPALEAQGAGSKMLLRMGPPQAARIKAQLRALRAEIARKS